MMNKIIIFLITLFCTFFFFRNELNHFSISVFLSSLGIIVFCTSKIFTNVDKPYSLQKMFYLFSFFFYGIAPLVQFIAQTSLFGARLLREDEYLYLNILILIIFIIYEFFYSIFSFTTISGKNFSKKFEIGKCTRRQCCLLIILSISSFFLIFYINGFNFIRLLLRGGILTVDDNIIENSSSLNLIIMQVIRPIPFVCFYYYYLSQKKIKIIFYFLLVVAVLSVFPTGVPRYYAAAVYIPLLILLVRSFRKRNVFSLTTIASLLIVFPFLNNFRHYSSTSTINLKLDFGMFTDGHFDSYQNFALIYFEEIITYGRQLLGVVLFWLPRSIWPDKPVGSGFLLANKLRFTWENVSANYFAEGFINFGHLGILLFIIILAFVTAKCDNFYWSVLIKQKNNFLKIFYLVILGMLFFILRGDLLSSTAFTIGFIISIILVHIIVHRRTLS